MNINKKERERRKTLLFFRLLNNDWYWTLFTRICTSLWYTNWLREKRTKLVFPRHFEKFVDIYQFIFRDERPREEVLVTLLSSFTDKEFEEFINDKWKRKL